MSACDHSGFASELEAKANIRVPHCDAFILEPMPNVGFLLLCDSFLSEANLAMHHVYHIYRSAVRIFYNVALNFIKGTVPLKSKRSVE